jgi:predicted DCC family thiol-disulfide oxidoreductase YuxK
MDNPLGIDDHRKFTRALVTVLDIDTSAALRAAKSPVRDDLYAFLVRNGWEWNGHDWVFVDFC